MRALSETMYEEIRTAALFGFQGEVVTCNRRTEDALIRRGLVTYEYDARKFHAARVLGYRSAILTTEAWNLLRRTAGIERPADQGRYSLEKAQSEAYGVPSLDDYAQASRIIQSLIPGVRRS